MVNQTFSVGVMSSYKLEEHYMACKNSWLKDFNFHYIFGGYKPCNSLISLGHIGEDWTSAFLKQQLGLKYMYEKNPNLCWYSIFGSDNIVFKNRLELALLDYNPESDFFIGTRIKNVSINGFEFDCLAGGGGFFLSKGLMSKIYNFIDDFNIIWYNLYKSRLLSFPYGASDIALSYMLSRYFDVHLKSIDGIFSHHMNSYGINIKDPLVLHYISPAEMESIYLLYS